MDTKKKMLLEALRKTLGVVTPACKMVEKDPTDCENLRRYHYRWLEIDPEYKESFESIADIALDFAESKLHKQIETGNTVATIFFLKTKGKTRGYIERQELTGRDGKDLPIPILGTLLDVPTDDSDQANSKTE